jgi:ubiquinone/menaquinone biosynthesis C-methylase UbiE
MMATGQANSAATMAPDDPYKSLAEPFLAHYDLLRGLVRYELAARQVDRHLPAPPGKIIDVGGGAGHQTFRLAERGYDVVLADPSESRFTPTSRCSPGCRRRSPEREPFRSRRSHLSSTGCGR